VNERSLAQALPVVRREIELTRDGFGERSHSRGVRSRITFKTINFGGKRKQRFVQLCVARR
jgi:hypothetical protein